MALKLATRAWSSLSNSNGLGKFQTAYWYHLIYVSGMALLNALTSSGDSFSQRIQRDSPDGVDRTVTAKGDVGATAWELSGAMDNARRLFTSQFFSYLHVFFANNSFCTLTVTSFWDGMRSNIFRLPRHLLHSCSFCFRAKYFSRCV